jgi:hypothetical protein
VPLQDEPDAAFQRIGFVMRKLGNWGMGGKAVLAFGVVLMASGSAHAAEGLFTCDEFASAVAEQATKDIMQPAGDFEGTAPGKVLVIAAGKKFYIPPRQVDERTLAPQSIGQRMRAWNNAYSDAFWRCRYADNLTINLPKR